MKEIFKTLCPIAGGLFIGDSISTFIVEGDKYFMSDCIEMGLGISLIGFTFYLIFKK